MAMTKQQIIDQIAALQAELTSMPDDPSSVQPTPVLSPSAVQLTTAEQSVDNLVNVAAGTAGNWIHSPQATTTLSTATGIAPIFIHLGFMLASLFQKHSQATGIPVPQLAPPATK